jgi:hypothetical protein
MLNVSAVPSLSRHPSFSNYLTVELAVLEEISQSLAVLFGLKLPFQRKKVDSVNASIAGYRLTNRTAGLETVMAQTSVCLLLPIGRCMTRRRLPGR